MTDKPTALAAAKLAIETINAKEAERLRLAGVKRVQKARRQAKGMAT